MGKNQGGHQRKRKRVGRNIMVKKEARFGEGQRGRGGPEQGEEGKRARRDWPPGEPKGAKERRQGRMAHREADAAHHGPEERWTTRS